MTTEITVPNADGELVHWKEAVPWSAQGIDDLPPRFPYIRISTAVSRMVGSEKNVGNFWHSDREGEPDEFTPNLDVVLLSRIQTRAMFEAGSDDPVCRSSDGKAPAPEQILWTKTSVVIRDGGRETEMGIPHGEPATCGSCMFSVWQGDAPPLCKNSDVYLVDRGTGDLARLRVSGTNLRPLRDFIRSRIVPKELGLFQYRLHLSTERKQRGGNTWHQIKVKPELLSDEEASVYARLLAERHAAFREQERDEAEHDAATVAEEGPDPVWPSEVRKGEIQPKAPWLDAFERWRSSNGVTPEEIAAVAGKYDQASIEAWIADGDTRSIESLQLAILQSHPAKEGQPALT